MCLGVTTCFIPVPVVRIWQMAGNWKVFSAQFLETGAEVLDGELKRDTQARRTAYREDQSRRLEDLQKKKVPDRDQDLLHVLW